MSEKLYKVVKAIDTFNEDNPIPDRCLIFEDQDGNSAKEFFPEDRTTLFFKGELYDWYGRKVELKGNIAKVLSYYGDAYNSSGYRYETFVTKLADGQLAIACLEYKGIDLHKITEQIYTKHHVTGDMMFGKPFLNRQSCPFESFYEPLNSPSCLVELNSWLLRNFNLKYKICINSHFNCYGNKRIQPILFMSTHLFLNNMHYSLLEHYIFANRDAALKSGHPIRYVRELFGNLEFSKNGSKMTAYAELANSKRVRISTDTDVVHKSCKGPYIYWYLDPELEN